MSEPREQNSARCQELTKKHAAEDMALVVLIPNANVVIAGTDLGYAQVFSPGGRMSPHEAASLLHQLAWSLEGTVGSV